MDDDGANSEEEPDLTNDVLGPEDGKGEELVTRTDWTRIHEMNWIGRSWSKAIEFPGE